MTMHEKHVMRPQTLQNVGGPQQQQEGGMMMDELMQSPQPSTTPQPSFSDQLKPFNTGPVEDFIITMMSVADGKGVLDSSFAPPSVEDEADLLDEQSDPMQFLTRDELVLLVSKFMAIPEPQRTQLADKMRQQLPPHIASRLEAVVRFAQGRGAQQQVAQRT